MQIINNEVTAEPAQYDRSCICFDCCLAEAALMDLPCFVCGPECKGPIGKLPFRDPVERVSMRPQGKGSRAGRTVTKWTQEAIQTRLIPAYLRNKGSAKAIAAELGMHPKAISTAMHKFIPESIRTHKRRKYLKRGEVTG
jgi:hypothetical protein